MVSESSFLRIEKKGVDVNREHKKRVVEELHAAWSEVNTGVVTHYRGLSVADMNALRSALHAAGVSLRVVKNTLARRAAQGTDFSLAEDLLTGPVAVAYGNDPVGLAKALSDFSGKKEALKILGGVLAGKRLEKAEIMVLAGLPSRDILLARIMGSMQSPLSGFVRTLHEIPASFVRTLAAIRDQQQGTGFHDPK